MENAEKVERGAPVAATTVEKKMLKSVRGFISLKQSSQKFLTTTSFSLTHRQTELT